MRFLVNSPSGFPIFFFTIKQHLPTIDDYYRIVDQIGQGGYGSVYKAFENKTGDLVALKKVKIMDTTKVPLSCAREISALKGFRHENIVDFKGIVRCSRDNSLYLVLEYCNCDLDSLIHHYPRSNLNFDRIRSYFSHLLQAIYFLHSNNVVHRDIKPANILINRKNCAKLADFGFARLLTDSRPMTIKVMTPSYTAPEVLLGDNSYSSSIDMWSLGCVLYEMVTGIVLFRPSNSTQVAQLSAIHNICGSLSLNDWQGVQKLPNFILVESFSNCQSQLNQILSQTIKGEYEKFIPMIKSLLILNPEKRITAQEALQDPLFSNISLQQPFIFFDSHSFSFAKEKLNVKALNEDESLLHSPPRVSPPPLRVD